MTYNYHQGVKKDRVSALGLAIMAAVLSLLLTVGILSPANAVSGPVSYTNVPLSQAELDANWSPDRTTPSGGFNSTTFASRNDVLEMRIDKDNASTLGAFYLTEGLQRHIPASDSVKADVYVDSDWTTNAKTVRAGLWGVGHDSSNNVSSYPIVEFTTDGFTGWRYWSVDHWVNLTGVAYNVDAWNTLTITHDSDAQTFVFKVNGTSVASAPDEGSANIGAVILNSKNYAPAPSYNVHWSNFAYGNITSSPTTKDSCKANGWQDYGFRNQGLCIQYVNTGKDSR